MLNLVDKLLINTKIDLWVVLTDSFWYKQIIKLCKYVIKDLERKFHGVNEVVTFYICNNLSNIK